MDAATENHISSDGATVAKKRGRPKGAATKKDTAPSQAANPSARITAIAKKQALKATTGNASAETASDKVERRGRPKGTKKKSDEAAPKKVKADAAPKKTKVKAPKGEEANIGEKRKRGRPAKADKGDDAEKPAKNAKKVGKVAEKKEKAVEEDKTAVEDAEAEADAADQEASELQLKGEDAAPVEELGEEKNGVVSSPAPGSNAEEISEL